MYIQKLRRSASLFMIAGVSILVLTVDVLCIFFYIASHFLFRIILGHNYMDIYSMLQPMTHEYVIVLFAHLTIAILYVAGANHRNPDFSEAYYGDILIDNKRIGKTLLVWFNPIGLFVWCWIAGLRVLRELFSEPAT
jgi:hypothetical protein